MHVLIVDDTAIARYLLRTLLEERGHKVSEAESGEAALAFLSQHRPDIITMDVHMPGMNGIQTTREIMNRDALPILIVSGSACPNDSAIAMEAMAAGALAVLEKPTAPWDPRHEQLNETLLSALEQYARAQVKPPTPSRQVSETLPALRQAELIAIGASAGGPNAIATILRQLVGVDCPPILIVQHIAPGFVEGYAEWLKHISGRNTKLIATGMKPERNQIYLAPDCAQTTLDRQGLFVLQSCANDDLHCPSIDQLFISLSAYHSRRSLAILLSGMGRDGLKGCELLRQRDAMVLVQTPDSAVVDSMPRATIEQVPGVQVLSPERIAEYLARCSRADGRTHEGASSC